MSNGAAMASHPPTGPLTLGSENITEAVPPAVTVMVRSAEPVSLVTVTLWSAGVKSVTVIGDVPRALPSTETRAPGGSVTTDTRPTTTAGSAGFISK